MCRLIYLLLLLSVPTGASEQAPKLQSNSVLVVDVHTHEVIISHNDHIEKSIASITKLMTAMVVIDSRPNMNQTITITKDDIDTLKHTSSRLPIGSRFTRAELLKLALMSSENRAAHALARNYPGGYPAFIQAMNIKATTLGMYDTHFEDATGLTPLNVSNAADLSKLVIAASEYPLIQKYTTTSNYKQHVHQTKLQFLNSNKLVRSGTWDITISKTGFINEAGRCLVMMTVIDTRTVIMVFLDADGKYTPQADAEKVKKWIELK